MPLKNGIGVVALRRAGAETLTDTVIIRIDARSLPQSISGRTEAMVVLWLGLLTITRRICVGRVKI